MNAATATHYSKTEAHTHIHTHSHKVQYTRRAAAYRTHQLNNKHAPGTLQPKQILWDTGTVARSPRLHKPNSILTLLVPFVLKTNKQQDEESESANFWLDRERQARAEALVCLRQTPTHRAARESVLTFTDTVFI